MAKKGKEAKRREKKQRTGKKHMSVRVHEYYEVSGDSVRRKRKTCPRCGPGAWLAEHRGRLYCGKCGYTEFEKRPAPAQPEQVARAEAPPEKPSGEPGPGETVSEKAETTGKESE